MPDYEFKPSDSVKKPTVAELFVVIKLSNGNHHIVNTTPEEDDAIAGFLFQSKKRLSLNPNELPINFFNTDGRTFISELD